MIATMLSEDTALAGFPVLFRSGQRPAWSCAVVLIACLRQSAGAGRDQQRAAG